MFLPPPLFFPLFVVDVLMSLLPSTPRPKNRPPSPAPKSRPLSPLVPAGRKAPPASGTKTRPKRAQTPVRVQPPVVAAVAVETGPAPPAADQAEERKSKWQSLFTESGMGLHAGTPDRVRAWTSSGSEDQRFLRRGSAPQEPFNPT